MHKILLIISLLILMLAACGGDDEDNGSGGSSNEASATATPVPTVNVPEPSLSSADVAAGTFTVLLTGQSEQTIEESKLGRDNRNQDEHVLMLIDTFSGFGATLYFPFDIQPGTYTMSRFQPTHTEDRYSATVTTRATGVYYAVGGVLVVEEVENGLISGKFSFIASDQSGARTYNAEGAFNQIPLKQN